MQIVKKFLPLIAAVFVLTSLVVTGMTASRLLQFERWNKIPLRLKVEEHALPRDCGEDTLHTLLDGDRLWTACGPDTDDANGGLAQIALDTLTVRQDWRIEDGALALSEVEAVTMTDERELVLVYRYGNIQRVGSGYSMGGGGHAVAIAGPDGWIRPPEALTDEWTPILGAAWVDDKFELILDPMGDDPPPVLLRVGKNGEPTREEQKRDRLCRAFETGMCAFIGAYRLPEKGWGFAVRGYRKEDMKAAMDAGMAGQEHAPAPLYWDVSPDGATAPRKELSMEEFGLDLSRVGVVGWRAGRPGAVLEPDGSWSEPLGPQSSVEGAYLLTGNYVWSDGELRSYLIDVIPRAMQGQPPRDEYRHRIGNETMFLSELPDPYLVGPALFQVDGNVVAREHGSIYELMRGQFVPRPDGGYMLVSASEHYLLFSDELVLVEPRGVFEYIHQVDPFHAWGIYWTLFGLLPVMLLCLGVVWLVRRKHGDALKRFGLSLTALAAATIHASLAMIWLFGNIWHWLR